MNITFHAGNIAAAQQALYGFSDRRINGALTTALVRTAEETVAGIRAVLPTVFDRPTPWTLGGFGRSRVENLRVTIFAKDQMSDTTRGGRPAAVYLTPQVRGGARRLKAIERLLQARGMMPRGYKMVPGRAAILDAYGNFSGNFLTQVLSQLRVAKRAKPIAIGSKRLRSLKRAGGYYFSAMPGNRQGLSPGILFSELGTGALQSVIRFVPEVRYAKRFDFQGITHQLAVARLSPNVRRSLGEALRTLQARNLGLGSVLGVSG